MKGDRQVYRLVKIIAMKSTKVQTLGVLKCVRDIANDDIVYIMYVVEYNAHAHLPPQWRLLYWH